MFAIRDTCVELYQKLVKLFVYQHNYYQYHIPAHKKILVIGAIDPELIASLRPTDLFTAQEAPVIVDYVIIDLEELDDIQNYLDLAYQFCDRKTRVIFSWRASWTAPLVTFFFRKKSYLNRPTQYDIEHLVALSNFQIIKWDYTHFLVPFSVPLVSRIVDTFFSHVPGVKRLCIQRFLIARAALREKQEAGVSIIITCRNERGNIFNALTRLPQFGLQQEIIFVEGHSRDNTLEEIYRAQSHFADKNIKVLVQAGKGKGDAVRAGFSAATQDILMILDGDLTMPPEELPKFYKAIIENKGELINGSRLMYHRESHAMPRIAVFPNYCFALGFSWLFGQKIKDTLCGTKVLWREDYEAIAKGRSYFGDFDPFGDFDLLFGAAKKSLKIIDMPIRYKNRTYGTSQIRRFSAGIQLLRMFLLGVLKFKIK